MWTSTLGAHYEWVDINWLKMIAGLDNVELHIAGKGRGAGFKQLISMKNVRFHGELDTYQLFELMKVCKVGLLAFKDIELIKGVDPIKVYDYAAAGLEIWAPDIKALYSNKYINTFIKDADSANKALNNFAYFMQRAHSHRVLYSICTRAAKKNDSIFVWFCIWICLYH